MTEWYEKSPALAGLFEWNAVHSDVVRVTGLEPARFAAQEPKSCASANSATPAYTVSILITGGASYVKQPLEEDFL